MIFVTMSTERRSMKNKQEVKQAVRDILWMARRYADGRKTYAPHLFNDAYDTLRDEFGDEIDPYTAGDKESALMLDPMIEHSHIHPYALYGDNSEIDTNVRLKERKYYGK